MCLNLIAATAAQFSELQETGAAISVRRSFDADISPEWGQCTWPKITLMVWPAQHKTMFRYSPRRWRPPNV